MTKKLFNIFILLWVVKSYATQSIDTESYNNSKPFSFYTQEPYKINLDMGLSAPAEILPFSQDNWIAVYPEYYDRDESILITPATKIRQFSQNPWEFDIAHQYENHSAEISHSIDNLWNEGTIVAKLQGLFRNTNRVGSSAQQAYAIAGDLYVQTGNYYGFSLGASYMLTNPFIADLINPGPLNIFIPTNEVSVLSQAFIQYLINYKLQ